MYSSLKKKANLNFLLFPFSNILVCDRSPWNEPAEEGKVQWLPDIQHGANSATQREAVTV